MPIPAAGQISRQLDNLKSELANTRFLSIDQWQQYFIRMELLAAKNRELIAQWNRVGADPFKNIEKITELLALLLEQSQQIIDVINARLKYLQRYLDILIHYEIKYSTYSANISYLKQLADNCKAQANHWRSIATMVVKTPEMLPVTTTSINKTVSEKHTELLSYASGADKLADTSDAIVQRIQTRQPYQKLILNLVDQLEIYIEKCKSPWEKFVHLFKLDLLKQKKQIAKNLKQSLVGSNTYAAYKGVITETDLPSGIARTLSKYSIILIGTKVGKNSQLKEIVEKHQDQLSHHQAKLTR